MQEFPYDHWQQYKTKSGLPADAVISSLQKEIRRGNTENAATLAYEMLITSTELEEYLWYRLKTISVEDIGFANPFAPVLLNSLDQLRKTIRQDWDRRLMAIHAVRYLCSSKKDRSSDEMFCWIQKEYEQGTLRPEIPDYALDKHTLQGQSMGRSDRHFYEEGAKVEPEWDERDDTYLKRLLALL